MESTITGLYRDIVGGCSGKARINGRVFVVGMLDYAFSSLY